MSNRTYSHPSGSTCRVQPTAKFQQVTTPSGLTLEVLPPRPRSLVPLAITTVLLWSAVGAAAWLIYTHLTAA